MICQTHLPMVLVLVLAPLPQVVEQAPQSDQGRKAQSCGHLFTRHSFSSFSVITHSLLPLEKRDVGINKLIKNRTVISTTCVWVVVT